MRQRATWLRATRFASAELLRPVEGVHVEAERVLLQASGIGRRLQDDGKDGAPPLGGCDRVIDIAALEPFDAEAVVGGADDARHFDGDLRLSDLRERIVVAG